MPTGPAAGHDRRWVAIAVTDVDPGWVPCRYCLCLYYHDGGGRCPVSQESTWEHRDVQDGEFAVPYGDPFPGAEDLWWLCRRCQRMVRAPTDGVCFRGQPHDQADYLDLRVPLSTGLDGPRPSFAWCSRCGCLVYQSSGLPPALCDPQHPHTLGPERYVLDGRVVEPPPPPPPPPPVPAIRVTESDVVISVEGEHFTPGGAVLVAFHRGGDVVRFDLPADDDGRFGHYVDDFDPEPAGGLVLVNDIASGRLAVGSTTRHFPRVSGGPVPLD